jgi:hypothetical protein
MLETTAVGLSMLQGQTYTQHSFLLMVSADVGQSMLQGQTYKHHRFLLMVSAVVGQSMLQGQTYKTAQLSVDGKCGCRAVSAAGTYL